MKTVTQLFGKIGEQPKRKKIHELSSEELSNYRINEHCEFNASVWFFANSTPGAKKSVSTINWGMKLAEGSQLTDVRHAARLHWAKILVLTLLISPSSGRVPAPGAMGAIQAQLKWLLSWMAEAGYHHPHELTPDVIQDYLDRIPRLIAANTIDGEIGIGSATRALMTLVQLWEQRLALAKMGVVSIANHPYGGKGAATVAKGVITKVIGWVKPLPDEVAIPMLNKAAWLLGTPADDVCRLLDVVRDPLAGTMVEVKRPKLSTSTCKSGTGTDARRKRANKFIDAFEFSPAQDKNRPWHEEISHALTQPTHSRDLRTGLVRQLWEAIRDAAAITVQAASGMRVSELLGIRAGIDVTTGLPNDVRLEPSGFVA